MRKNGNRRRRFEGIGSEIDDSNWTHRWIGSVAAVSETPNESQAYNEQRRDAEELHLKTMTTTSKTSEHSTLHLPPALVGRRTPILLGMILASLASLPGSGQEKPEQAPSSTIKVSTEVVNVYAVVEDKKKHLIADLKKEDFEVQEDGKPQEIRYFSRETDTPLTLGIMVDTSPSQGRVLGIEQEQADA